jgi:hypothetical protein
MLWETLTTLPLTRTTFPFNESFLEKISAMVRVSTLLVLVVDIGSARQTDVIAIRVDTKSARVKLFLDDIVFPNEVRVII